MSTESVNWKNYKTFSTYKIKYLPPDEADRTQINFKITYFDPSINFTPPPFARIWSFWALKVGSFCSIKYALKVTAFVLPLYESSPPWTGKSKMHVLRSICQMIVCWPSPELDYINSESGDTVHCQIEYDVNYHCNSTHFALVAYSGTRTFGGGQFNLGVQVCGVLMCSCNTSLLDCCTDKPTKNNKGSEVNEMVLQGKFKSDIRVWTLPDFTFL